MVIRFLLAFPVHDEGRAKDPFFGMDLKRNELGEGISYFLFLNAKGR